MYRNTIKISALSVAISPIGQIALAQTTPPIILDAVTIRAPQDTGQRQQAAFDEATTRAAESIEIVTHDALAQAMLDNGGSFEDALNTLLPGLNLVSDTNDAGGSRQDQLRGRRLQVLLDGIPQGSGVLRGIGAYLVDRVELQRLGTAQFGYGATGGALNVITRRQATPQGQVKGEVSANVATQVVDSAPFKTNPHLSSGGQATLFQGNAATSPWDWLTSVNWQDRRLKYDGDGQPIPTFYGRDAYQQLNVFGRLGRDWGAGAYSWLNLTYAQGQATGNFVPTNGNAAQGIATQAQQQPTGAQSADVAQAYVLAGRSLPLEQRDNWQAALHHQQLLADQSSVLRLTAYSTQQHGVNNALRYSFGSNTAAAVPLQTADGFTTSDGLRNGWRVQIEKTLANEGSWTYGAYQESTRNQSTADFLNLTPQTQVTQPLTLPIQQQQYAIFSQWQMPWSSQLTTRFGMRYEWWRASVSDFRLAELFDSTQRTFAGGVQHQQSPLLNAGLSYRVSPQLTWFGGWAQGFSTADWGSALRNTLGDSTLNSANLSSAQAVPWLSNKVNSFEWGARGVIGSPKQVPNARYAATLFYNTTANGLTTVQDPLTGIGTQQRAPEFIYGVDASLDVKLTNQWRVGSNFVWQDGRRDVTVSDGSIQRQSLLATRLSPWRVNAYVDYQVTPQQKWRMSVAQQGARDDFNHSTRLNEGRIDGVTLVNLSWDMTLHDSSSVALVSKSSVEQGATSQNGAASNTRLVVLLNNLTNQTYVPWYLQAINSDKLYTNAVGRTLSVNLIHRF